MHTFLYVQENILVDENRLILSSHRNVEKDATLFSLDGIEFDRRLRKTEISFSIHSRFTEYLFLRCTLEG